MNLFEQRRARTYKEIQLAKAIPEYQRRLQEIKNKLNLEDNQKKSLELFKQYDEIKRMRESFLTKVKNVEKEKDIWQEKISDVTSKLMLTNNKEEEKDLLEKKAFYKSKLEQLGELKNVDIYPTIKGKIEELVETKLSKEASLERVNLEDRINKELDRIKKEEEEARILYKNLKADLMDMKDNLYHEKCRELHSSLKNQANARIQEKNNVKYAVYMQDTRYR